MIGVNKKYIKIITDGSNYIYIQIIKYIFIHIYIFKLLNYNA